MSIAVYPGSFDPVTYGHIDIIERSAKVFDKLIIAVLVNSAKKPMFTTQEKVDMIRKVTSHLDNVEVMFWIVGRLCKTTGSQCISPRTTRSN